jgi:hypothetical protein
VVAPRFPVRLRALLGAGSLLLGGLPLRAFSAHARSWQALPAGGDNDRILVLIRLDGGNDGAEHRHRSAATRTTTTCGPTLGIPDNKLWALSNEYGMPQETNCPATALERTA